MGKKRPMTREYRDSDGDIVPVALMSKGELRDALGVPEVLVPYIRVSTDDKGQDVKRQLISIRDWANREGFILLDAQEDIGTSASKTSALERPHFLEACKRAKAAGATGILMETPDRFSRRDPRTAIWEWRETERLFDVQLFFACMTREMQNNPIGQCFLFIQQAAGHIWVLDHAKKVESGMAKAIARGTKFGRKSKVMSEAEIERIKKWRKNDFWGWEKIAVEINSDRGVHMLTSQKDRYERSVSSGALRRMARDGVFGPDEIPMQVDSNAVLRGETDG